MKNILKKIIIISFLALSLNPHMLFANESITAENNIIIDAFTERKNRLLELIN